MKTSRRAAVIVLVLLVTRTLWLPLPGRFLVVADAPLAADAIVPLAGEPQRIVYGADLFGHGQAGWFVATDMYVSDWRHAFSYADWAAEIAMREGVPAARILTPPGRPATTYDEALAVRQLAIAHDWHALLIVTGPPHSRRARLIFRDVFRDTGVAIIVQPVANHPYTPDTWWVTSADRRDTGLEYLKLVHYFAGFQ